MENLNIDNIIKKFNLLIKVNNENYVSISELSKEMKVLKTELMEFIENNNELFKLNNVFKGKKNLGLCIFKVYKYKSDNPKTIDFAIYNKEKYNNTIFISKIIDYGYVKGYCVIEDIKEFSSNNEYIWRNTKEKIEILKKLNILDDKPIILGTMCDSRTEIIKNVLCENFEEELHKNNWTFKII